MLRKLSWSAAVVLACVSPIVFGAVSAWAADWDSILVAPPKDDSSWDTGRFLPSARQAVYHENQMGAFLTFGLFAYTTTDADYMKVFPYTSGMPDKSPFNPTKLDAEQWVLAAKSFGATYVIYQAKHHDGFCMWQTKTTDYSLRGVPWKNGKGDIMREMADACKKHGLKMGLYCSPADKNLNCWANPKDGYKLTGDRDAYFRVYMEQVKELCTNYGDAILFMFDGYCDPFAPNVTDATGKLLGSGDYEKKIVALVRSLQPRAAILGPIWPTEPPRCDLRWVGNEDGMAPYPIWNVVRKGEGARSPASYQDLGPNAEGWFVHFSDVFTRARWGWQPNTDDKLTSVDRLMTMYYTTIGGGVNFIVNLTPDPSGLIPEIEVKRVADFGAEIRRRFGTPVARTDSSNGWAEPGVLELDLGRTTNVVHVVMEEDIAFGQHVLQYAVDAKVGNQWKQVAQGESIGRKRIHRLETPVSTDKLRLRILKAYAVPQIRELAAYDTL